MYNLNSKTVNAWWPQAPKPGNFGDVLTPWLIKKLTGYTAIYTAIDRNILMCVGSILGKATEKTTVWGSGAMKSTDKFSDAATYLAVRGPISRELVVSNGGKCPDVLGDPGLLLPALYSPTVQVTHDYGFFPHYVDYEHVNKWYGSDPSIKIINALNANPLKVVDQIRQCKRIISSSLHGIIVAQAYGIPATWVKFSDKLYGDGTKFMDYFQSVKIEMVRFDYDQKLTTNEFSKLRFTGDIQYDPAALLKAFPRP